MRIANVHIKNFRCILDETIDVEKLTILVGPNGAGKSATLKAIDLFYQTKAIVTEDDFYNRNTDHPIEITVMFTGLSSDEEDLFSKYVRDDTLSVTKVVRIGIEKYHGTVRQNPEFARIRKIDGKRQRTTAYRELRIRGEYQTLRAVGSADEAEEAMEAWEREHPDCCEWMRDDGQFFGFRQVGQAHLERNTRFVFVPAVRDAEREALDERGSAIHQLMEFLVRSVLTQEERLAEFKNRVQEEYTGLISAESVPELGRLAVRLSENLRRYVPSADVRLNWRSADSVSIPLPRAEVRLEEDGYEAPVDRVGHGLQRAFILSILQSLVSVEYEQAAQESLTSDEADSQVGGIAEMLPDLIIAIEEPELYQHPNRQRSLSRVLRELSEGAIPGVAERTQVIYSTHSPFFVELSCFDAIRRLTKSPNARDQSLPYITCVSHVSMESLARELQQAQLEQPKEPFSGESLKCRLAGIMTPLQSEGLFADVVVLVEGLDDRAALLTTAFAMGADLEGSGVGIIPSIGKNNLDRLYLIFNGLGISSYVVFDGDAHRAGHTEDSKRHESTNRRLQRLLGIGKTVAFPATIVDERYAVFQTELDRVVMNAVGEQLYIAAVQDFKKSNGYNTAKECRKSPAFIELLLKRAGAQGIIVNELHDIVARIQSLSRLAKKRISAMERATEVS